jgi:hypothetical protein
MAIQITDSNILFPTGGQGQNEQLKSWRETSVAASVTGSYAIDCGNNDYYLTLTGNCTFTITNPPTAGQRFSITIALVQDTVGNRTVTWPTISWGEAGAPVLSTAINKVDYVVLSTRDGGGTWHGWLSGRGF